MHGDAVHLLPEQVGRRGELGAVVADTDSRLRSKPNSLSIHYA